jgi:hypothetical protein
LPGAGQPSDLGRLAAQVGYQGPRLVEGCLVVSADRDNGRQFAFAGVGPRGAGEQVERLHYMRSRSGAGDELGRRSGFRDQVPGRVVDRVGAVDDGLAVQRPAGGTDEGQCGFQPVP